MGKPAGLVEKFNKKITRPLAKRLAPVRWLSPNLITWISFILSGLVAPFLVIKGKLQIAGLLVLLGAWLDSLDGDLARERGQVSAEGAILDAVLDRYTDLFLIASLILYCNRCLVAGLLSMVGSSLVPYVRAKVEACGKEAVATFGSRDIRNVIVLLGLILRRPFEMLWILAIVSNLSALHRFYFGVKR